MHCASCVSHVQRAIEGVPGVASASVNLTLRQAAIEAVPNVDRQAIIAAVASAGYQATVSIAASVSMFAAFRASRREDLPGVSPIAAPDRVVAPARHTAVGLRQFVAAVVGLIGRLA